MSKGTAIVIEGVVVAAIIAFAWLAPWSGWVRAGVLFLLLWANNVTRDAQR